MTKHKARILSTAAAASLAAAGTAHAQSLADIEAANERLVRDFFANAAAVDFDNPDPTFLHNFLAEDFVYQYEDLRIEGLETYIAGQTPVISTVQGGDIDVRRIAVIGNTVLNERVDIARTKDGDERRRRVSSVFLVEDGKIAEWREFPPPDLGSASMQTLADLEARNEQLARDWFAASASVDFDNPDPSFLWTYLAEDFVYQYEDLRIEGLETFIAGQAPVMSSVASAATDLRRITAIGNTVLNERVDVATLKDGQERRWHVSSVILIADGKIAEWLDYPLPETAAAP